MKIFQCTEFTLEFTRSKESTNLKYIEIDSIFMLFVNNYWKGIQRNKKRNLYRKVYLMLLNYLFNTNEDSRLETDK